jgi:hypothetical protein
MYNYGGQRQKILAEASSNKATWNMVLEWRLRPGIFSQHV